MVLELSKKLTTLCVEFEMGDPIAPTYMRICDAQGNETIVGHEYLSEPAFAGELETQTGAIEDKPTRILLPVNRGMQPEIDFFVETLASPAPVENIRMRMFEVTKSLDGTAVEILHLAEGQIESSRLNPEGKKNILELSFVPSKSTLKDIPLGIPANASCGFTYGAAGCMLDIFTLYDGTSYFPNNLAAGKPKIRAAWVEVRSFYLAQNARSQVVNLTLSPFMHAGGNQNTILTLPRGWWLGSYLTRNGLSIPVRDWWYNLTAGIGTNTFVLGKIPPTSWLYNSVPPPGPVCKLIPGCSKTHQACDLRNNLVNWGGFGHAIPAYNPLYDEANR